MKDHELNELKRITRINTVRQTKLTSSILVATRQNENKFSHALAAPRIREIRYE